MRRRERRARLQDVRDRELLAAMVDLADPDGFVTSEQVARAYNIQHDKPVQCAGARLSWMRRWGLVERDKERGWRLTDRGLELRNGKVSEAVDAQLRAMGDPDVVDMIGALARRRQHGSREAAIVGAREWRYYYTRDPKRLR